MPRPRKYSSSDYPVTFYVKIPLSLENEMEVNNINKYEVQKKIEESKIVENFIRDFVEKNRKKD